jgi:hypothetical protein
MGASRFLQLVFTTGVVIPPMHPISIGFEVVERGDAAKTGPVNEHSFNRISSGETGA